MDFWRNEWNNVTSVDDLFDNPVPQGGGANHRDCRPKFKDFYNYWPKNSSNTDDMPASNVFSTVFGDRYDPVTQRLKDGNKDLLNNACATRASIALTLSGTSINRYREYIGSYGAMNGKGLIAKASVFYKFLLENGCFLTADLTSNHPRNYESDVQSFFKGNNGIYIMIAYSSKDKEYDPIDNFGASGHVGLWINDHVLGGHHYIGKYSKAAYLFTLK